MASYRIIYWQDIPAQVLVSGGGETLTGQLSDRFQQAIDAAAMAAGQADEAAYLGGWQWGPEMERAGEAREVLQVILAELEAAYPQRRLTTLVQARRGN